MAESQHEIYTIFCLTLNDDSPFPVDIANNKTVGHLKKLIKEEAQIGPPAHQLSLYHVEIKYDEDTANMANNAAQEMLAKQSPLLVNRKIADVFKRTPREGMIHIIAKLPETLKRKRDEAETDQRQTKKRVLPKPVIPSSATAKQVEAQLKGEFDYGRPPRPQSIPLALLNETFGNFMNDVQTYEPTKEDNRFASELRQAMLCTYADELHRVNKFRAVWNAHVQDSKLLGAYLPHVGYITDGDFRVGDFFVVITEGKGELTGISADPLLQAGMYYLASLQTLVNSHHSGKFPCLLIYYAGPYIGFAGAVYTDVPQVELLTPLYPWHTSCHETEVALQLTRALSAAKKAVESLKKYYEELGQQGNISATNNSVVESTEDKPFPYRTYYDPPQGGQVAFRYVDRIFETRLMFLAESEQEKTPLFVKFTRKYSAEAHQHCAEIGIAPRLHAVNFLPGGWIMVVMDYLTTEIYDDIPSPFADRALLRPGVQYAINELHAGGFVHGDLRDVNMKVRKGAQGPDMRLMLLDFDWAGKEGQARYPPHVNFEIFRPNGVTDGGLIEKAHDQAMIDQMFTSVALT